jgi:transcription elongation factor GreA
MSLESDSEGIVTSPSEETLTLREVAATYLASLPPQERQDGQAEVHRFVRWYGADRRVSEVSGHDVSTYAESLGVTLADAARKLEPLRSFFGFAKKKGFTASNFAVNVRPPKPARAHKAPLRVVEQAGPVSLTREGIAALEEELEELRSRRPKLAEELKRAMSDKDFRENAPLDAAREAQGHLESRIREIEATLNKAVVFEKKGPRKIASLGSTVYLRNLKSGVELKYMLVNQREVNPAEGKISIDSPVGKALVRRREGEEVEVSAPAGAIRFRIEKIQA